MITVSKSAFQADFSEYFRRVEAGEELIVTDNHVPVLKMLPVRKGLTVDEAFADARGKIEYFDDPLKPETEEWGDV